MKTALSKKQIRERDMVLEAAQTSMSGMPTGVAITGRQIAAAKVKVPRKTKRAKRLR